jgi:hypothetical protein
MTTSPEMLIAVLAAMVAGLLGFSALLLLGGPLVRAMRLPPDLLDGPRFEPPPPPLRTTGERSAAGQAASRQAGLAALYARVRDLELAASECQALSRPPYAPPAHAGDASALADHVAAALAASSAADAALRAWDERLRAAAPGAAEEAPAFSAALAAWEATVQGAVAPARRLVSPLAQAPAWRLLLLVAVLVLWLVGLAAWLWR